MRNEELGPVYQFILEELKIPLDSEIEREYSIRIGERELHIDLVIKSKKTISSAIRKQAMHMLLP